MHPSDQSAGRQSFRPTPTAWTRWQRLSAAEKLTTLEALGVLTFVRALVSATPSSFIVKALESQFEPQSDERVGVPASRTELVDRVCTAIRRASLRVPRASCLVQALSGWIMLRSRGVPAVMRIGVRKDVSGIAAHAWLCLGERVIIGGEDAALRFTTLGRSRAADRFD